MQFSFGVQAVHEPETPREWISYSRDWLQAHEMEADLVLLAEGSGTETSDCYRIEIANLKQMRDGVIA